MQASSNGHRQHPTGSGSPCPLPFHGQFLAPPRLSIFVFHALHDSHFSMQTNRHTTTQTLLQTHPISGILMLTDSCPASRSRTNFFITTAFRPGPRMYASGPGGHPLLSPAHLPSARTPRQPLSLPSTPPSLPSGTNMISD